MKWLFFFFSHSLFIAICAVALCFETAVLLQYNLSIWFYCFIFFATLSSYNFYWLLSKYSFTKQPLKYFLQSNRSNGLFFLTAAMGATICLFNLLPLLPFITIAVMLTILYAVPLMPFKFVKPARKAGLAKTLLLAFSWTYVTVYLPYVQSGNNNFSAMQLLLASRFLFMLMLCIIFDVRDVAIDKIRGLQSLSTMMSAKAVHVVIAIVFTAQIIILLSLGEYYFTAKQITALLVAAVAALSAYWFSLRKQNYYYYYFLVDGLMLFSVVLTYMVSI